MVRALTYEVACARYGRTQHPVPGVERRVLKCKRVVATPAELIGSGTAAAPSSRAEVGAG